MNKRISKIIFKQIMALILSVVIIGLGICETKNFIFANAADTNISDNSIIKPESILNNNTNIEEKNYRYGTWYY